MNPQKFEQLIHNFFGASCLELDVFDTNGGTLQENGSIIPHPIIEQAVMQIINDLVIHYKYEPVTYTILKSQD